jgi:hypothetical protein
MRGIRTEMYDLSRQVTGAFRANKLTAMESGDFVVPQILCISYRKLNYILAHTAAIPLVTPAFIYFRKYKLFIENAASILRVS